jgi:ATP-dependent DNA helicase UvrD/PcrA
MAEPNKRPPQAFDLDPPAPAAGGIAARAMGAHRAPYLEGLNPEQRAAVETLEGPVLVLAGAGTGKTRVLTARIAHILATRRARAADILAVTFTNKAAREMKARVGHMVGEVVEGMPWLGTFHSIGAKILRRHAELVGLKPDFTILDTDDQIRLLKQLLAAENIDEKRWPARVLASMIDGWKNRGLTSEQTPAGEATAFANGRGQALYAAYQARLKTLNAADFGDLLLETIRLFRTHPEVLRQYQARFKYILVDEYQDTNVAQYLWLRLLGQRTVSGSTPGAPFTSPRARGESLPSGEDPRVDAQSASGEGQHQDQTPRHTEMPPHPGPLPAGGERGISTSSLPGMTRQSMRPVDQDGSPGHAPAAPPGDDEGISPNEPSPPVGEGGEDQRSEPGEGCFPRGRSDPSLPLASNDARAPSPARGEGEGFEAMGQRATTKEQKNICCVGDDDQSIYGWRGAEVDNILRFEHDFPGAKVVRLERNYRSTGHILGAASYLIAHNEGRLGKTLRSEGEAGDKVVVASAWDSEEEARAIGEEIEQLQRHGEKLDEIAILVRASFQMREFEDRFVTLGLPYRVIGGPRFYERAEIRDALAYLRLVNQSADDLAFERIVNVPKRGLGDATLKTLHDLARAHGVPLMEAARLIVGTEELKAKPRQALRDLVAAFDRWRGQRDALAHTELAEIVLDESGYTEMWQKDRSADAAGRLENLKELVRSMEEFENLQGFLEHVSLVMDVDRGEDAEAVSIMTLHAAKGLEFDCVFLPGWEEGLLPHQRSLDENGRAGLEEERRLAHVGLTRARKRARISFVANRRIHGSWSSSLPSRFIDELPEAHVEVAEAKGFGGFGGYGNYGSRFDTAQSFSSNYGTPGWRRAQKSREGGGFGEARQRGFGEGGGRDRGRGFNENGQRGFGEGQNEPEASPDQFNQGFGDAASGHLSPVGRGRSSEARSGEGDQTFQTAKAPSPDLPRTKSGQGRPLPAGERWDRGDRRKRPPLTIEGELVARSTGAASPFTRGDRVFHQKFGNGEVLAVDGNKLTIQFDKAGEKRVVDSFVQRV